MTFEELLTNVEFNRQVAAAKDAQEVVSLFAARGIQVPVKIAQELFEQPADAELSAEDLDDVVGGAIQSAVVGGGAAYIYNRMKGSAPAVAAVKHACYGLIR